MAEFTVSDSSKASLVSSGKARLALLLPLCGFSLYLIEAVFGHPNLVWALFLLIVAITAGLLGWHLARGGGMRIIDYLDQRATKLVVALILITSAALVAISIGQARRFALSINSDDTAYYNQVMWNTLHGHFLSGNVQQERMVIPPATTDLAIHVSPVPLLVFIPIYALFPSFLTLLIVRDIVLVAAAWPLFLLARDRMGGLAGLAAAVLYLTNPAVLAQGFEAFNLLQLAPLPFLYALRAFSQEELGAFLCWMGVGIGIREDVAIAMAGFGLWAVATRRKFRWWALGLGIPATWWILATLVIQPVFGRSGNNLLDVALAGGNHGALGVYQVLLSGPVWLLAGLKKGGLHFLFRILRSVAFLGILGAEGLLIVPSLAANLFLARAYSVGSDPLSRFAILPSCALVGAAVLIVSRMARKYRWDTRVFPVVMLLFLPAATLVDNLKEVVQEELVKRSFRNDAVSVREALGLVPSTASVAAPTYALPALSQRRQLFHVLFLHLYPHPQPEYVLLDRSPDRMPDIPDLRNRYLNLLKKLPESEDYEVVWDHGDYFVLRRKARSVPASGGQGAVPFESSSGIAIGRARASLDGTP